MAVLELPANAVAAHGRGTSTCGIVLLERLPIFHRASQIARTTSGAPCDKSPEKICHTRRGGSPGPAQPVGSWSRP